MKKVDLGPDVNVFCFELPPTANWFNCFWSLSERLGYTAEKIASIPYSFTPIYSMGMCNQTLRSMKLIKKGEIFVEW